MIYFDLDGVLFRFKLSCDKGIAGDKISGLLTGTDFEFLSIIRQV